MPDEGRLFTPENQASQVERILALKRLPTIGVLPASDLAVFAEEMRHRLYPKGALLLEDGMATGAAHFVQQGQVHVTRAGRFIGHAGPGGAVGPWSILGRDPRGIRAVAETDVLTLELRAEAILEIFEDHFGIFHHVLRDVCTRLVDLVLANPQVLEMVIEKEEVPVCPARELDFVERILFLRQSPVFRRASINALAELSRGLTEVRLEPGQTLWTVGDSAEWTSLIVSGELTLVTAAGHVYQVGPGSPLGSSETIAERPRWYTAVTRTPVVALNGSTQGLLDVFEDNFEMAMDFMAVMARWMVDAVELTVPGQRGWGDLHGCTLDETDAG